MKKLQEVSRQDKRMLRRETYSESELIPYVIAAIIPAILTAYLVFYLTGASSYPDSDVDPTLRSFGAEEGRLRFAGMGALLLILFYTALFYALHPRLHRWWHGRKGRR